MPYKLTDLLGKTAAGRAALDRETIALLTDELRRANRQYARLLAAAATLAEYAEGGSAVGWYTERAIKAVRRAQAERKEQEDGV